jgi:hypothetical protein
MPQKGHNRSSPILCRHRQGFGGGSCLADLWHWKDLRSLEAEGPPGSCFLTESHGCKRVLGIGVDSDWLPEAEMSIQTIRALRIQQLPSQMQTWPDRAA